MKKIIKKFAFRRLERNIIKVGLLVILLGCLGLFIVLRYLIFPGFINQEEQEAQQNIQRISNSIDREIKALDVLTLDY